MGGQKNTPEPAPAALHRVSYARQGAAFPRHVFLCLSLAAGVAVDVHEPRQARRDPPCTHTRLRTCASGGCAQLGAAALARRAGRQLRSAAGVGNKSTADDADGVVNPPSIPVLGVAAIATDAP